MMPVISTPCIGVLKWPEIARGHGTARWLLVCAETAAGWIPRLLRPGGRSNAPHATCLAHAGVRKEAAALRSEQSVTIYTFIEQLLQQMEENNGQ